MQRRELEALTSLRGVAAMAIVLQHFCASAAGLSNDWIPSLVPHGYMAVDFFFVLSGFIMAYNYQHGFETRGMQVYWPFLYKRVARILPLGIAVTLLILLCAAVAAHWNRADLFIPPIALEDDLPLAILINLANLQGFLPRYIFNAPSWSVSLEFGAYLLFPFLLRLFFTPRRWTAIVATAACILTLAVVESCEPSSFARRPVAWNVARCLAEFGFGLLAYRAYRGSPALRALGQDRCTVSITLATVLSGVLRLDLFTALLFPSLVLAYALNRGNPARLVSLRPLYLLGLISFSIYLTHNILRAPLSAALHALHPTPLSVVEALLFAVGGSLLVLPLATTTFLLIEKPGRTALTRLAGSLSPNFRTTKKRFSLQEGAG